MADPFDALAEQLIQQNTSAIQVPEGEAPFEVRIGSSDEAPLPEEDFDSLASQLIAQHGGSVDIGDLQESVLSLPDGTKYLDLTHPEVIKDETIRFAVKNLPTLKDREAFLKKKFETVIPNGEFDFLVQNPGDALPYRIEPSFFSNLSVGELGRDLFVDPMREIAIGQRSAERGLQGAISGMALGSRGGPWGAAAGGVTGGVLGSAEGYLEGDLLSKGLVKAAGVGEDISLMPSMGDVGTALVEGPVNLGLEVATGPAGLGMRSSVANASRSLYNKVADTGMGQAVVRPVGEALSSVDQFFRKLGNVFIKDPGARSSAQFITKDAGSVRKIFEKGYTNKFGDFVLDVDDHAKRLNEMGLFKQGHGVINPENLRARFETIQKTAEKDLAGAYRQADKAIGSGKLDAFQLFDTKSPYPEFGTNPDGSIRNLEQWFQSHMTESSMQPALRAIADVLDKQVNRLGTTFNFTDAKEALRAFYRRINFASDPEVEAAFNTTLSKVASIWRRNLDGMLEEQVKNGTIKGYTTDAIREGNSNLSASYFFEDIVKAKQGAYSSQGLPRTLRKGIERATGGAASVGLGGFFLSQLTDNPLMEKIGMAMAAGFTGGNILLEAIDSNPGRVFRQQLRNALGDLLVPSQVLDDAIRLAQSGGQQTIAQELMSGDEPRMRQGLMLLNQKLNNIEELGKVAKNYDIDLSLIEDAEAEDGQVYIDNMEDQEDIKYDLAVRAGNKEVPWSYVAKQSSQFSDPMKPKVLLPPYKSPKTGSEPDVRLKKPTSNSPAKYSY